MNRKSAKDMLYRLAVKEGVREGKKYGVTNWHAEDRAKEIERSAHENGHPELFVTPEKYIFDPTRSEEITALERRIHSDKRFRKLFSESEQTFEGSSEIYTMEASAQIEELIRKANFVWKNCGDEADD